jgi:arginase family enzyme
MPFDASLLDRLRQRYASAAGGDIRDPRFKAVADQVFQDSDSRKWPFSGPATFIDAPFRPDGLTPEGLAELDVALIGIPMDLGVTNRTGARLGPRAVRAIERVGPYEHVLGVAPMGALRVADVGDVPMRSRYSLADCHADIEACYRRIAQTKVVPLSVGGDHSITGSILKGLA